MPTTIVAVRGNTRAITTRPSLDFNEAIRLNPDDVATLDNLAWLHATCPEAKYRDGKKAVENASKAYQLDGGKHWGYCDTLAAAYAESGDFDKAKEWASKAIDIGRKRQDGDGTE